MTKAMAPAWESGEGHERGRGEAKGPGGRPSTGTPMWILKLPRMTAAFVLERETVHSGTRGSDLETQAAAPCPPPDPSVPRVCEKTAFSRAA